MPTDTSDCLAKQNQTHMKTGYAIFVGLVIGVLSGIGFVHLSLGAQVAKHETQLEHLKETYKEHKTDLDKQIANLVRLWEAQIAAERELISLVRQQITQNTKN